MEIIFMSATKIGENTTNILNLFITINSDLITWNQTLTHKKLKLSFTSSIYLVVLPLEMWRGLKQTNVYQTFFFLFLKRNDQTD